MKRWSLAALMLPATALAQDLTWMNGQSRQREFPFALPGKAVTLSLYIDSYYAYSIQRPADHTLTGTASVGRHGEFQLNLASVGVEWSYKHAIGRLSLQTGDMLDMVQDQDRSVDRGRNASTRNLRNIREATVGYHWDAAAGVNLEAGIFMSYIGLESYLLAENWNYNRSLVCEFTPFYFQGVRLQWFPSARWKVEPWVMNGWQTYAMWNDLPSVGVSTYYRPSESLAFVVNAYTGTDTPNEPSRRRYHTDHSMLARYYNAPHSHGVSKAAFSINNHLGMEQGGGAPWAKMLGTSIAHRLWLRDDRLAFTLRGEAISNPGRYLAIAPTPTGFIDTARDLRLHGLTATIDVMPSDLLAWRFELMTRAASAPYFADRNGLGQRQQLFVSAVNFRM